jgi:hypothetical protein
MGALPIMLISRAIAKRVQAARPSKRVSVIAAVMIHQRLSKRIIAQQ